VKNHHRRTVERSVKGWGFLKLTNMVLKKPNPKTSKRKRIQGWKWMEGVETGRSMVEEEPAELLDKDKSPMAMDRDSNETDKAYKEAKGALKEARNDGGMRNTRVKGKGEEEPSHGS